MLDTKHSMFRRLKDSIRLLLPPLVWEAMHNLKKIGRSSVTDVSLPIGPFTLILPSTSYLPSLYTAQPFRDLAVGIIAKYAGEKYRDRCMVDVGANVGGYGRHDGIVLQKPAGSG